MMKQDESNTLCKCPKKCERHGKCEECISHHEKIKKKTNCKRNIE